VNFQNISILGATGSIGENTLDVIQRNPDRFRVVALTAHRNTEKLAQQCAEFGARLAVIADPALEGELAARLSELGSRRRSGQERRGS
jgi:1-deoxy-D-xylulose-5-phosphate reductoisomerase